MATPDSDVGKAFDKLAAGYQAFRPHYPDESLVALCGILDRARSRTASSRPTLVDVGAGTGILTRQLASTLDSSWRIVGIEPNDDMRREAERSTSDERISYQAGYAESLPFGDGTVSAVVAAQAAQWFDRTKFYPECGRVLHPNGAVAILQNNRDWKRSRLLDEYEELLEAESPGYTRHYRSIDFSVELDSAGFKDVATHRVEWIRQMSIGDFVGMALSSTKVQAAARRLGQSEAELRIREIVERHTGNHDDLPVAYLTELFTALRP
ncbi:class I SAM-dependent methyltransferase [Sorangium sp. So ce134]